MKESWAKLRKWNDISNSLENPWEKFKKFGDKWYGRGFQEIVFNNTLLPLTTKNSKANRIQLSKISNALL